MKKSFVKTQNVKNFITLMEKIQKKSKMALVYGDPGLGKTQSILWWAAKNDAAYIRASNSMSVKWFLEELVEELGETPMRLTSDLFKQVLNQIIISPRVIIVDEIDYLLNESKVIETIRDIYDRGEFKRQVKR
jgi:DNA transposition AAA+ family ATPase